MGFRQDWLHQVIQAPYVPTLGVVSPAVLSAGLFDAVAAAAHSEEFLPYDKDRRWSDRKQEHVLPARIIHSPQRTVIPTLTRRGGVVKLHHYSATPPDPEDAAGHAAKLAAEQGASRHQVLWWSRAETAGARTRLMQKNLHPGDRHLAATRMVAELDSCPARETFAGFARDLAPDGFGFLHERMRRGCDDGPVLVTCSRHRIVAAIGPLSTLTDRAGTPFLPPQYFAVHPEHRGRGHGRALWQAAMAWGHRHGAAYQVLQAATGSPAEQLYLSEGLTTLGFLHAT